MTAVGRSELQMRRALLAALAAFDLVGLVSTQTVVGRVDPIVLPVWYEVVFVVGFALPVVAALAGFAVGARALRRLTVIAFAGAVTPVVVLLGLAIADPGLEGQLPWMISSAGAAAAAAALAWGSRAAWAALVAITIMIRVISALVDDLVPHRVSNDTQAVVLAVVAILLFGALLRSTREVDEAAAAGIEAVERRAAAEAKRAAAVRARTIVHDEVLATLLQAARGTPQLDLLLAAPAATAASRVRALVEPEVTGEVPLDDLRRRLAELTRTEVSGAAFTARLGPGAPPVLPATPALALVAGTRQALVNAARHAPGAPVGVTLVAGAGGVRVITRDEGPGFDPAAVPPDRLGVSASIRDRLRAVPGGAADIVSAPGAGTTVTLRWRAPGEGPGAPDTVLPSTSGEGARGIGTSSARLTGDPRFALILLLVSMTALAIYSSTIVAEPWVPALAIVLVLVALAALGWVPPHRPSLPRSLVTVSLATLASLLVAVGDIAEYRLMTGWYATAAAFVLSVLAMRGRPVLAILATLVAVAATGALSAVRGAAAVDIVSVLFRPVLIGVGVALVVLLLAALARRARRLGEAEVQAASAQAWRDAERAELRDRWARLDAFIGPTLDRLAEGRPLSAAERQECALAEGALRDVYRGARLAREPLVGAARRARARGVDVVLLDDAPDEPIDEGELAAIANWLAAFLDRVPDGPFTGRILPAERPGRASATSQDAATLFRGEEAFGRA